MAEGPIQVVIAGAAGRMGRSLLRLCAGDPRLRLVGATVRAGAPALGRDLGELCGLGSLGVAAEAELAPLLGRTGAAVVVDFTEPEASVAHASACAEAGAAFVCGTTGLLDVHRQALSEAAAKIPVVVAPNMAVGVNVMFRAAALLARTLGPGFDAEVVELHHRRKKDAPSGTALRLAEEVAAAQGRGPEVLRTARSGPIGERPAEEIGVATVRGGDVVGEHTVYFLSEGERVELTHRATDRDLFARGALRAASWVVGRAPGLYDMQDVLGLRG